MCPKGKNKIMKFGVLTTGYKGILFLKKLNQAPDFVVTYDNKERKDSFHYKQIIEHCNKNNIPLYKKQAIKDIQAQFDMVNKLFVVGWQFLIKNNLDKVVVFHDSYLPERRGFAPTISALLDKSQYLGATSFAPSSDLSKGPDYGKVYYRKKKYIQYPITLKKAFEKVSQLYADMANNILKDCPVPVIIDYKSSSYSLWRDEEDSRIDWSNDANQIQQKVYSLGYPYMGATTKYEDKIIYLEEIKVTEDLDILNREEHIGKIYKLEDECPHVVCGKGLIKIIIAKDDLDQKIIFNKLRKRFK